MQSSNLNERSLFEVSDLIHNNSINPAQLIVDCIQQIERYQDELGVFTTFDSEYMHAQLQAVESRRSKTLLHGIPVGVKDIMQTSGMLTTMGSPIYREYVPTQDAAFVAMLKNAGAIVAGKTESTEFAYFSPGKTRNPHNIEHTPGGSSMGSAAAVAKNMVPLALGTQTAGSVIRPAAYCGVTGYKASHGSVSLVGIFGFAQSLDSMGFFVRQVRDLMIVRHTLFGSPLALPSLPKPIRIGFVKTPHWSDADDGQRAILAKVCNFLDDTEFNISEVQVGPVDGSLTDAQGTVMAYEGCRSLTAQYAHHSELLSDPLKALIEKGRMTTFESYQQALALSELWQGELMKIFNEFDVLLTPSAPGEAPRGLSNTGDPIFNRMWTLLKVPCIHLPCGYGTMGLPLGIQLVGPFNQDDRLIGIAHHIEGHLRGFEFNLSLSVIPD